MSITTAHSKAYLAMLRFAQIPLRGTSDTLETLYKRLSHKRR